MLQKQLFFYPVFQGVNLSRNQGVNLKWPKGVSFIWRQGVSLRGFSKLKLLPNKLFIFGDKTSQASYKKCHR